MRPHADEYRKKPVVIEARRWDDVDGTAHWIEMWAGDAVYRRVAQPDLLVVTTLADELIARPGDWIIRGVAGEFYPIQNDIFREAYEAVRS